MDQQQQQQQREVHHSKYQHSQHNQLLLYHRTSSSSSPFQVLHHRKGGGGREVPDKMLWPLVNSGSEAMVTLGLPILVTILMLLCVLFVLILIIRKRTEPKIPDLSDYKSDPLLDEDRLFESSITRELFYPPIGRNQQECLRMDTSYSGLFGDGNSNKNSWSSNLKTMEDEKKRKKKGLSAHLDWLSPSSSEWLSINDDLYKNYYQDPRGSFLTPHPPSSLLTTSHPVTSLRRRNSCSPIRDWPRDELLFPRRGSSGKQDGKEEGKGRMLGEYDDPTARKERGNVRKEESVGFTYNSPQPERIPLPSSSFISSCSSRLRSYNSTNNLLPYHQYSYPSSNHFNPYLGYQHHSDGSSAGLEGSGMSCCDPAPRFDPHSSCLCSLNHFPHHGPT